MIKCSLVVLLLLTTTAWARPHGTPINSNSLRPIGIVDGDTIWYGRDKVRAVGYDAPETFKGHYHCAKELKKGLRAKAQLTKLLSKPHKVDVKFSKGHDKYGRRLAVVMSDNRDVGAVLISDGLAVSYNGHGPKPNYCR